MSNPFKPHALNLFSQRDTIDEALAYANQLINALDASDRVAALTALMVVVNTAAKVWPEAPAQAQDLGARVAALEEALHSTARVGWTRDELVGVVKSEINEWSSDGFDARADEWLNDHADLDHEIERWMENNFDLENEVQDTLRSASFRISF